MHIRRTQKNDAQILRSLGIAALSDAPYAFGARLEDLLQKPLDKFTADALRHSESDISTSFLAFDGDQPIGMIGAFFEIPSQRAFICSFWVRDSYRGGVCSVDLLDNSMAWLKARDAQKCHAWVADSNIRAIRFYNKHKFVNSGINQPLPSNPSELEHLYERVI